MRKILIALALGAAWPTAAIAGSDKVVIAPAPSWVKPVPPPADASKPDEAAIRILLSDMQMQLGPDRQTVYTEFAVRIQTPQGLAAGNISFPWRPETDTLTVHKLIIRRGAESIDVLAGGQTFTVVRRETSLESATLDGVLTANIQPEGLQVGDVLQFAVSVSTVDPVLNGHVEQVGAAWNGMPFDQAHLRAQWPSSLPLRVRQAGALPPIKPVKSGATTSIDLSLAALQPISPPKGAPVRFQYGRLLELTDFASWNSLSALLAPLYVKAATIPAGGPLAAEVAKIAAASPDPRVRAEAALALVQDRVRYVALLMGAGGLTPADAGTTWGRRYGDCKAKTALLLGILRTLGITAEPVAVNAGGGDGIDSRLPMIGLFNHVLVRATIAGKTYWLDGTRTGDTALDRLAVPSFGWGLPLLAQGAALVRIMPPPLERPISTTSIRIDARAGVEQPAPAHMQAILRDDLAVATNAGLSNLVGEQRDRALKNYWKSLYDFVDVKTVTASYDPNTGEERFTADGTAKMEWKDGWYEADGVGVGYKADFARDAGPDRDAPFAVPYPYHVETTETILLPGGFKALKVPDKAQVAETVAGIEYRRHATFKDGIFSITRSERSVTPEFAASEAPAAQARLRALADMRVWLRQPAGALPTGQDVKAALALTPTDAAGFVARGNLLLDAGRPDEAAAAFTSALAIEPGNVWALACRSLAYFWKGETAPAMRDLAAAAAIDPRNPVVLRASGVAAQEAGRWEEAITAFTAAIAVDPGNSFALGHRAEARYAAGQNDAALADAAATIKISPGWAQSYLLRANIFRQQGSCDKANAEADALIAAAAEDAFALSTAARIYHACGKRAEAMRTIDRAVAISPSGYVYLNRFNMRDAADVAGRRTDIAAAMKVDPQDPQVLATNATMMAEDGNLPAALASYAAALKAAPRNAALLEGRGIVHARAGRTTLAEQDFAAARAAATGSGWRNSFCWDKATAGVALDSALADCNAALLEQPLSPAFLDSRGLVLLRLGRIDEAIADYDKALTKAPQQTSSLWGRAVAWARKGDRKRSDADAASALTLDPDVQSRFARYGVRREEIAAR